MRWIADAASFRVDVKKDVDSGMIVPKCLLPNPPISPASRVINCVFRFARNASSKHVIFSALFLPIGQGDADMPKASVTYD